MQELDFQPEMIGREDEICKLQTYLDKALEGHGNTLFISGEAGIGKTRLINEVKQIAKSKGFQVLFGNSLYESLTPFMPFMEALKSGNLESLFAEDTPNVEAIYLVTDTGLLIKEVLKEETKLDPDLFASMLTAVSNFVKESLSMMSGEEKEGTLNTLGYMNRRILIESGEYTNLVVILTGKENEFLINDMKDILVKIEEKFGDVLKVWDGHEKRVKGVENILSALITSGKYDGIYYGKDNPKARRNLLFENVTLGLIRQAELKPTLLCIEDLQWTDPSTLALMHYVARNTRKCNLLLLGTYRPEDVVTQEGKSHPLIETMQLMSREDLYEKMVLQRLPKEYMSKFLSSILKNCDFDGESTNHIYKESEGNPLFIIELIKLLVEEGTIVFQNGTWKLKEDLKYVDVPSKIFDVIERRLDRLTKDDRKILDYGSVIGDVFTVNVLSNVVNIKRVDLLEKLRRIEQSHRLINSQKGEYRFDHGKIKEVLYNEIPRELRKEYHTIIADTIEKLNKDQLDDVIGDLAFHYYHCKNKKKAALYLIEAAKKAKNSYSNKEAIRFYNESLEVEELTDRRRELFEGLGEVFDLVGDYEKCIETYENALKLTIDVSIKAKDLVKIGSTFSTKGEYDKALKFCNEALELVKHEESNVKADALQSIGVIYLNKIEYEKALEHLTKSLAIYEKVDDKRGIAAALQNISSVYFRRGVCKKALEQCQISFELFEKLDDQKGIAHVCSNIGAIYHYNGEYDKAIEHFQKSLNICERIGEQQGIAITSNNIGVIYEDMGEYDKALEHYEKSLKIIEKIGDLPTKVPSLHNIGNIHYFAGNFDKAIEQYEKSLKLGEKIGDPLAKVYNYCGIAEAYFKKGVLERAEEYCNSALKLSEEIGLKNYLATSNRILGMIFRERRQWQHSINKFEDSIRLFKEIGLDKELGKSSFEYGLMWKNKGDVEKSSNYFDAAIEIFEKMKLEKELKSIKDAYVF